MLNVVPKSGTKMRDKISLLSNQVWQHRMLWMIISSIKPIYATMNSNNFTLSNQLLHDRDVIQEILLLATWKIFIWTSIRYSRRDVSLKYYTFHISELYLYGSFI